MLQSLSTSFEKIFLHGPAAYIILANDSPNFTILDVNGAYLKVTGTIKEEIVGKGIFKVFPGNPGEQTAGMDLLRESLMAVLESKEAQKMPMHRYDIFDPEKGYIKKYWTGINTPILNDEGEIECIIHSPLDVTYTYELSRKEKEIVRALHQQRNDLFAVFKHAPVGIGIFKGDELTVELANDELCHLLGAEPQTVLGKDIYDLLKNIAGDDFLALIKNSVGSDHPFVGYELPLNVRRNGKLQEIYINFAYEKINDPDWTLIVVVNDVTAQVVTRKKLEESEQRLNMAVTASNMGVWDTNLLTGESIRSLRHAQIFGYPDNSEGWSMDAMFRHILPDDLDRVKRDHDMAYSSGAFESQFRIKTRDEKQKWIHALGHVQYDKNGVPVRMLGTVTDITGIKELEKLKDEFISTVSHEIKTPVTSIKAYGQLLQRKMLSEDNLENALFLKKIDVQINRLTDLVHHLLDVTRIDNNKVMFKPVNFDLTNLSREIIDDIQQISSNHRINFIAGPALNVVGDTERIRQVIVNMLTNAIKYSPKANIVDVLTFEKGNYAHRCVRDYGIGIPQSQQAKIFDRFYQADERANAAPGLGLGLYISSQIISRQQGEMWVESRPGKGSSFYFKLPLASSYN